MNTGRQHQENKNAYYPLIDDHSEKVSQPRTQDHSFNSSNNLNMPLNYPQQVQHHYQPYVPPQQGNGLNHPNNQNIQGNQPAYKPYQQNIPSNNRNQNQSQNTNPQVIVYQHNNLEPNFPISKPGPPHVLHIMTNKNDAIIQGQSFPCQKCGLQANGALSLHSGEAACVWGTFLFLATGIFCWLPCVMPGCKNTHITCTRCGYKRAIIKAKLCC